MRGGHCLKVWTKKQQVVSLSSAESELYAAVKAASEGLGIQSVAKDLGISCVLNLHLDASAAMCLVSHRGLGNAKHVDMQNLWIQEASRSGRFVTKKVGTSVNPASADDPVQPRWPTSPRLVPPCCGATQTVHFGHARPTSSPQPVLPP